jgi:glucose/arabinose dehydrogenase
MHFATRSATPVSFAIRSSATGPEFEPPVQHRAPYIVALGMRFYPGSMFPPEYKNAVIIAARGSWNREHKQGFRVMVVCLDGRQAGVARAARHRLARRAARAARAGQPTSRSSASDRG